MNEEDRHIELWTTLQGIADAISDNWVQLDEIKGYLKSIADSLGEISSNLTDVKWTGKKH
jgi:hypothetical protein